MKLTIKLSNIEKQLKSTKSVLMFVIPDRSSIQRCDKEPLNPRNLSKLLTYKVYQDLLKEEEKNRILKCTLTHP